MLKGVIIENSLVDNKILEELVVERTWTDEDWILHAVQVKEEQITKLSESLNDGPWYIHLWEPGKKEVQVAFKDRVFMIDFDDKATWEPAIMYGKSIGIPEEQLDFPIDL